MAIAFSMKADATGRITQVEVVESWGFDGRSHHNKIVLSRDDLRKLVACLDGEMLCDGSYRTPPGFIEQALASRSEI